jgi:glycosyltransferase involved in cell wall biosynthesis
VLTAFACDPNLPSEPTIGWDYLTTWLKIASDNPGMHVLAVMNRWSKLRTDERLLQLGLGSDRLSVVAIDLPRWASFLKNPRLTRGEYLLWAHLTRKYLRKLQPHLDIVIARHVTFASELLPTPIDVLHRRAFTVWGPVGSSGQARAYLFQPRQRGWRAQYLLQRARDFASNVLSVQNSRLLHKTLVSSEILATAMRSRQRAAVEFPNTRLDDDLLETIRQETNASSREPSPGAIRLLCVGNLIPLKRIELAISALASPELAGATLRIVGKPLMGKENYLLAVAATYGVTDRVEFTGQVPRRDVVRAMLQADVLVHLSAREGASGAVGEATAVSLPVVCFEGTGAAGVLKYAGGVGVAIDANEYGKPGAVAKAIVLASSLKRRPVTTWQSNRYEVMELQLLREARQHKDTLRRPN